MTDRITPEQRSRIMSRIRAKGTKPEMAVRRMVHAMGYRYRLHRRDLPGTPDLVFAGRRKVVFVHGCFWHQHDDPGMQERDPAEFQGRTSGIRSCARNVERDRTNQAKLKEMGWSVLVIWECELERGTHVAERITEFLESTCEPCEPAPRDELPQLTR